MRAQHGVGHGVEAKQPSWARRRACPRKRASLIPPSAPRQPKLTPQTQPPRQRPAFIDTKLVQTALRSSQMSARIHDDVTRSAPNKRGFRQPPTADQAVLRHVGKRREDADMDRRLGLCSRRHRKKAPRLGGVALHIVANFLDRPLRENANISSAYNRPNKIQYFTNN